jgi:hypothetical protein
MSWGASSASQTAVSAPSSMQRVAFGLPISVRTHPGQITLTATRSTRSASANMIIRYNGMGLEVAKWADRSA